MSRVLRIEKKQHGLPHPQEQMFSFQVVDDLKAKYTLVEIFGLAQIAHVKARLLDLKKFHCTSLSSVSYNPSRSPAISHRQTESCGLPPKPALSPTLPRPGRPQRFRALNGGVRAASRVLWRPP